MTARRPNVILLSADAVTYTRLGHAGRAPSPTPAIDGLLARGLTFTNAFAVGCPTMFALPGLWTSTLPLDAGGYAQGIRGRGVSLAEVLRDAGYATGAFVTGSYQGRSYGYDRGFDDFHAFHQPAVDARIVRGLYLNYLAHLHRSAALPFDDCVALLAGRLPTLLGDLAAHVDGQRAERAGGFVRRSPVLHDLDLDGVAGLLAEARAAAADAAGYARHLLELAEAPTVFDRIVALCERAGAEDAAALDARLAERGLPAREEPHTVSGAYVLDHLCRWIDRRAGSPDERPFFAWAHPFDCHDHNYLSHDLPPGVRDIGAEIDAAAAHAALVRAAGREDAGALSYELSLRYLDEQVGRLLEHLESRGIADDTIVVMHSDHGGWTNGWPPRAQESRSYMQFWDENYHVPLSFAGPGIAPRTVDGLASAMDLAPTLLQLLGLPAPDGWRGVGAADPAWPGRPHVLMEHMHAGPCDARLKRVHLTIRTRDRKLTCELPPPAVGGAGRATSLFDLAADPLEQRDLLDDAGAAPDFAPLAAVAAARAAELFAAYRAPAAASAARVELPAAEAGLDDVVALLAEAGVAAAAIPAIERAIAGLLARTTPDDQGFELAELLAALRAQGDERVADWTAEAVAELRERRTGRPGARAARGVDMEQLVLRLIETGRPPAAIRAAERAIERLRARSLRGADPSLDALLHLLRREGFRPAAVQVERAATELAAMGGRARTARAARAS